MRKFTACVLTSLMVLPLALFAMASAPKKLTILLMPALHSHVQIGRDFVEREQVLLMTYALKTPPERPHLHAWSGTEWVPVSPERFANGSFLRVPAGKVLVVGEPDALTARLIEMASTWSPEVLNVESRNVTELINSLGRVFNFRQKDWNWFAVRYDLKLRDLNAESPQPSWYDTTRPEDIPPPSNPFRPQSRQATPRPSKSSGLLITEPAPEATPAAPESFSFQAP